MKAYSWESCSDHLYEVQTSDNLVAWWKLDEGVRANVFDSCLNRHHGVVRGGNPAGSWTTGVLSNAVTLGGTSSNWIQVSYHESDAHPGTHPHRLGQIGITTSIGSGFFHDFPPD